MPLLVCWLHARLPCLGAVLSHMCVLPSSDRIIPTLFGGDAAVKLCCVSGTLHYLHTLAENIHVNCNKTPIPGDRVHHC